jgi:hypothetical protein
MVHTAKLDLGVGDLNFGGWIWTEFYLISLTNQHTRSNYFLLDQQPYSE